MKNDQDDEIEDDSSTMKLDSQKEAPKVSH